jgi:hypothetical protein
MRVVNAKGCISSRRDGSPMSIVQRLRLERERFVSTLRSVNEGAGAGL